MECFIFGVYHGGVWRGLFGEGFKGGFGEESFGLMGLREIRVGSGMVLYDIGFIGSSI